MIKRQRYIEAVSFQMKNQDPERYNRRTNVNLKTEVRKLIQNPSSPVYKMHSPDSKKIIISAW